MGLAAAFADPPAGRQKRMTWMVFRKMRISKRRDIKPTEKFSQRLWDRMGY
jgi:hypothetical protein